MRFSTFIVFHIFIFSIGYAQNSNARKALELADSIVISNSSEKFLESIRHYDNNGIHFSVIDYSNPNLDVNKLLDTTYTNKFRIEVYRVFYQGLKIGNENLFIEDSTRTYSTLHVFIDFDSALNVMEQPDFKTLELANNRALNTKIISREEAKKISEPKFTIKTDDNQILLYPVYNLLDDSIYWHASKLDKNQNRNKEFLKELIIINAVTKKIIHQNTEEVKIVLK